MTPFETVTILVALLGVFGLGIVAIIRTLQATRRDVISFGSTISALALGQYWSQKAARNQNAALREIGANGSTTKADECLDKADDALASLVAARTGGETK